MRIAAFDIETSGELHEHALQPWRVRQGKAWLTSLAWVWRQDGKTLHDGGLLSSPLETTQMIRAMLAWAIENESILVGWNVVFDIAWLYAYGEKDAAILGLLDKVRFLDAMLLWRHLDIEPDYDHNQHSYSLKTAVPLFFPQYAGYEADIDYHGTDPEQLARLHEYNIKDCVFTLRLAWKFWKGLTHSQQIVAITEAASFKMIARANLEGLTVDTLEAGNLSACLKQVAAARLESLAPHGITEKIVRSPKQLGEVLYDQWKLPVHNLTPSGARSTDKVSLHRLALRDIRVKQIKEYREALNNDTKFAQAPLKSCAYNGDSRSHPQMKVFGTYSGRCTYGSKQGKNKGTRQIGFALHQEKRDPVFRRIIVPPPGFTLMEFDAAGQEYRWMAIASRDGTMLKLCQPGQDPHAYMGSRIDRTLTYKQIQENAKVIGSPEANARQCGKVVNLCVARDTKILTDRGYVAIQNVKCDDLVWDGVEFVTHSGVVCSGYRPVISYQGLTATPEHGVLVDGEWVSLEEAAAHGWTISSELGAGWAGKAWAAFWIVDGVIQRTVREKWRALCTSTLCLWHRARSQSSFHGDWTINAMQSMRFTTSECTTGAVYCPQRNRQAFTKTGQRLVSEMQQSEGSKLSQLRRTWDRMSIWFGSRSYRVGQETSTASDIFETRHRPDQQRWVLRARQPALRDTLAKPTKQTQAYVYDIVNCGPRSRFAANGLIVHNSSQYRVGSKKLQQIAEVDYGIRLSLEEAQRIQKVYLAAYPGLQRYWANQIQSAEANGYVETIAGRRVKLTGWRDGHWSWQVESTAINYRIQGTGADQKYLALRCVREYLNTIGARFAWDLHDGLYFYVPTPRVEEAAHEIKDIFDNLPYEAVWRFKPPIPMPWDCKVGPSWGGLRPFEFS
jgi:DNA polymerase I-like protein with 3'-5' exonuclease and polymerase domains